MLQNQLKDTDRQLQEERFRRQHIEAELAEMRKASHTESKILRQEIDSLDTEFRTVLSERESGHQLEVQAIQHAAADLATHKVTQDALAVR